MSTDPQTYIAVVDDDESYGRAVSRLLRVSGMQPVVYPSAELFLADTKHPLFDCLLIDVQLGGMSGFELQNELAKRRVTTPIVFVTGHDDPEAREQARRAGAVLLRKTEPGSVLLDSLRRAAGPTVRGGR